MTNDSLKAAWARVWIHPPLKPSTPNRPGCGGYVLALLLLLLLALSMPAPAEPQLTVNVVKGKWGDYRIDITCPESEDCQSIQVLGKWTGTKVLSDSPTHTWVEFWDVNSVPSFWVRIFHPRGGWVDYEVPATTVPDSAIGL